ncbi:enolase C-terminal domain-like protein [Paenibacillus agricola]|uniref:Mandelate racemase/muconate lactonizing protein n=1 Tax=Paenibacillus agricola TaxID=2716264 RepID=A0ABX0J708_9BACL|nr:enolase C-terminal domain-like protein [Paenibacillus agricola]NHN29844.1 mandelate racemase/muconate lactonizing protein [Paenibacillus agricola]
MKITDVQVFRLTGAIDQKWEHQERSASPLDMYSEYNLRNQSSLLDSSNKRLPLIRYYVNIHTNEGLEGLYGPLVYEEQADIIVKKLRPFLIGQDPLDIERLWDQMRYDRHGRNGYYMMALSSVDCALWDLRGKFYNTPVYRLLGGPTRTQIPVYASTLGYSIEAGKVGEQAKALVKEGYQAQKWFFRHGPSSGGTGKAINLRMAHEVREAIGSDNDFMLDCWMGWNVPYAVDMMDQLRDLRPLWLEEPLPPHQLDGYRVLKERGAIQLAAGEHLYTRKDFRPFLDQGLLSYAQPDPDWTGGITELRKIGILAETFDVQFVPHGCTVLPNLHVIASLPPSVCPYLEYLVLYQKQQSHFHKDKLIPVNGFLSLPEQPGLGIELDESSIESKDQITA